MSDYLHKVQYYETDNIIFIGTSEHCFIDKEDKLLRLKNCMPKLDEKLKHLANEYISNK